MFYIATSSLRRATAAHTPRNIIIRRHLSISMTCVQSVHKLNGILEEYRAKNYAQEFPRRFQKELVKAATVNSSRQLNIPAAVSAEGIGQVLENIGMEDRISKAEIENIVDEVGVCPINSNQCVISENQMLDLISKNWEEHHDEAKCT